MFSVACRFLAVPKTISSTDSRTDVHESSGILEELGWLWVVHRCRTITNVDEV